MKCANVENALDKNIMSSTQVLIEVLVVMALQGRYFILIMINREETEHFYPMFDNS